MNAPTGSASGPSTDALAILRIAEAVDVVRSAKQDPIADKLAAAKRNLRTTVEAAVDRGISWQMIGGALGVRRGAAYQRFRRPPATGQASPLHRSDPTPPKASHQRANGPELDL